MNRRKKAEIRALEKRAALLKQEADVLANRNRVLSLRHSVLTSWCDTLSLVQVSPGLNGAEREDAEDHGAQLSALVRQECSLLEQLGSTHALLAAAAAPPQPLLLGVATVAPPGDLMGYFKRFALRPLHPAAATMTPLDLAQRLQATTLQAGMQLHVLQHSASAGPQHEQALERITSLWDEQFYVSMSLLLLGRTEVIEALNVFNLQSLQEDPEGAKGSEGKPAELVRQLGLTHEQLHVIATGMQLYCRVVGRILQERQALQLELGGDRAQQPACSSDASTSTMASSGSGAGADPSLDSRQAALEAEQRRSQRLQSLLQKEYLMRAAGVGWLVGSLTYEQLSKAAVLSWPFFFRPIMLANEIRKWYEEQQQGQALSAAL